MAFISWSSNKLGAQWMQKWLSTDKNKNTQILERLILDSQPCRNAKHAGQVSIQIEPSISLNKLNNIYFPKANWSFGYGAAVIKVMNAITPSRWGAKIIVNNNYISKIWGQLDALPKSDLEELDDRKSQLPLSYLPSQSEHLNKLIQESEITEDKASKAAHAQDKPNLEEGIKLATRLLDPSGYMLPDSLTGENSEADKKYKKDLEAEINGEISRLRELDVKPVDLLESVRYKIYGVPNEFEKDISGEEFDLLVNWEEDKDKVEKQKIVQQVSANEKKMRYRDLIEKEKNGVGVEETNYLSCSKLAELTELALYHTNDRDSKEFRVRLGAQALNSIINTKRFTKETGIALVASFAFTAVLATFLDAWLWPRFAKWISHFVKDEKVKETVKKAANILLNCVTALIAETMDSALVKRFLNFMKGADFLPNKVTDFFKDCYNATPSGAIAMLGNSFSQLSDMLGDIEKTTLVIAASTSAAMVAKEVKETEQVYCNCHKFDGSRFIYQFCRLCVRRHGIRYPSLERYCQKSGYNCLEWTYRDYEHGFYKLVFQQTGSSMDAKVVEHRQEQNEQILRHILTNHDGQHARNPDAIEVLDNEKVLMSVGELTKIYLPNLKWSKGYGQAVINVMNALTPPFWGVKTIVNKEFLANYHSKMTGASEPQVENPGTENVNAHSAVEVHEPRNAKSFHRTVTLA
uniref:Uncharacterized protein n=1 Tax=Ditylenchus dipsaci TaxID=166011 RepID=A0A915EDS1_9BILA